jgi:hypothetical protein
LPVEETAKKELLNTENNIFSASLNFYFYLFLLYVYPRQKFVLFESALSECYVFFCQPEHGFYTQVDPALPGSISRTLSS